jgi:hypothetical protein
MNKKKVWRSAAVCCCIKEENLLRKITTPTNYYHLSLFDSVLCV